MKQQNITRNYVHPAACNIINDCYQFYKALNATIINWPLSQIDLLHEKEGHVPILYIHLSYINIGFSLELLENV